LWLRGGGYGGGGGGRRGFGHQTVAIPKGQTHQTLFFFFLFGPWGWSGYLQGPYQKTNKKILLPYFIIFIFKTK
jgi:hypothetical protein